MRTGKDMKTPGKDDSQLGKVTQTLWSMGTVDQELKSSLDNI